MFLDKHVAVFSFIAKHHMRFHSPFAGAEAEFSDF